MSRQYLVSYEITVDADELGEPSHEDAAHLIADRLREAPPPFDREAEPEPEPSDADSLLALINESMDQCEEWNCRHCRFLEIALLKRQGVTDFSEYGT